MQRKTDWKRTLQAIVFTFLALVFLVPAGCTRQHYRKKADKEVYSLLATGGTQDPRWKIDDYRITPDCRSRMYDPYNPDCEPMPPDDPTAHRKMHCVDGKKGSKHWHDCGCTQCVENPRWMQYLLFNDAGAVSMSRDTAVELALIHSPEYQSAMENLYLSAMQVSRERFRFDVQFYGGDSLFYTANGRLRESGGTFLQNDANIEAQKLLASGGEIVAGLANSVTWSFSGQNTWYVDSLFNVSLVQPLLRGAGRKIVLENLTQSERDFLASIRQMVFFQQGYYTKIVTGQGAQSAPSGSSRAGNTPSGSSRAGNTPSLGRGYYGLLVDQIQIQNRRQNIVQLEDNLQRFEEFFLANQIEDSTQVEETRQQLFSSESALLRQISLYQSNVETFLRSLGLPPDLKVEIHDPLIEQFRLSSPALTTLQANLGDFLGEVRKKDTPLPDDVPERLRDFVARTESEIETLYNDLETLEKNVPQRIEELDALKDQLAEQIRQGERIDPSIYSTTVFVKRIAELRDIEIPKNVLRLRATFTLIDTFLRYDRETLLKRIRDKEFEDEVLDAMILLRLVDLPSNNYEDQLVQQLHDLEKAEAILENMRALLRNREEGGLSPLNEAELGGEENVSELIDRIQEQARQTDDKKLTPKQRIARRIVEQLEEKDEYRDWLRRVLTSLQNELVSLTLMQTRARLDSVTMVPTTVSSEDAFKIASENRLDWMNQRSYLVDSWRQIDIAADRLKSDLNVRVEGELGTVDQKGVHFNSDNGRLRVGLEWDSPLTRHNEMLDYRASQIEYQVARRNYYTYVDSVHATLRDILRDIRINQVEFEINRNSVLLATRRVDLMQLRMDKPTERMGRIDTNTADQLIRALNDLLTNQNTFLDIWIAYQTQRMILDLNMGTLQLDGEGHWIDPGVIGSDRQGPPMMFGHQYGRKYAGLMPTSRKHRKRSAKAGNNQGLSVSNDPEAPIPAAPRLDGEASEPVLAPSVNDDEAIEEEIVQPVPLENGGAGSTEKSAQEERAPETPEDRAFPIPSSTEPSEETPEEPKEVSPDQGRVSFKPLTPRPETAKPLPKKTRPSSPDANGIPIKATRKLRQESAMQPDTVPLPGGAAPTPTVRKTRSAPPPPRSPE